MKSDIFYYQDCDIHYTDTGGDGPIIVLLHGFAETVAVWQQQVDFLKNHCRVIVPQIPDAHWQVSNTPYYTDERLTDITSIAAPLYQMPSAISTTTAVQLPDIVYQLSSSIDAMATALHALIEHLTQQPIIVLGHSMGGYITLALAEKYPQVVKAFGFVHSTAFADTEEKKTTRRKSIEFIRKNGSEAFFKTSAPGLFSEASKKAHPEWLQQTVSMAAQFEPEILISNYEAMIARPDRTAVLSGSKVPVLFILGKEDKAAPAADVLQQVHLPQVCYFHLLENVAHMGMWEATEQVNTFILKFV
jgi:pimeloyl-ACP methyl ester carboxylesterase